MTTAPAYPSHPVPSSQATREHWSRTAPPLSTRGAGGEGRLLIWRLGRIDYQAAWDLQRRLADARRADLIPDVLLLLEHPPTYTLGRRGRRENILIPPDEIAARGIAVYDVDRGGDVTYHGPDQLVGYPILKLPQDYTFVRYIRTLETALLEAVRDLGFDAGLMEGYSGVWAGNEKLCAIGVKVDAAGVTTHGFALNVNTDLSYFGHIVPCGLTDKGVTSLQTLRGRRVSADRVERAIIPRLAAAFDLAPSRRLSRLPAALEVLSLSSQ